MSYEPYRATVFSPWLDVPCHVSKPPKPWSVYDVEVRRGRAVDGEVFPYLVERGEPRVRTIEDVRSELFNHDLQKVNVSQEGASIVSFCSRFGVVASPLYGGMQRIKHFRVRHTHRCPAYVPADDTSGLGETMEARDFLRESLALDPVTNEEVGGAFPHLAPALLSERARRLTVDDADVVGAVSVAEVAQGIRLLQVATVLAMVVRHAIAEGLDVDQVSAYLRDRRYLSPFGADYFLRSEDPMYCGHRIDSYDAMLRHEDFRAMALTAEREGMFPRAIFDAYLMEAYVRSANDAARFLSAAAASYSAPLLLSTPAEDDGGPLAVFRRRRSAPNAELAASLAEGSVGEAVIAQFTAGFADPLPYRVCESCGRVFKKYYEEGWAKNIRETRYCRRSCNIAANKRKAT